MRLGDPKAFFVQLIYVFSLSLLINSKFKRDHQQIMSHCYYAIEKWGKGPRWTPLKWKPALARDPPIVSGPGIELSFTEWPTLSKKF